MLVSKKLNAKPDSLFLNCCTPATTTCQTKEQFQKKERTKEWKADNEWECSVHIRTDVDNQCTYKVQCNLPLFSIQTRLYISFIFSALALLQWDVWVVGGRYSVSLLGSVFGLRFFLSSNLFRLGCSSFRCLLLGYGFLSHTHTLSLSNLFTITSILLLMFSRLLSSILYIKIVDEQRRSYGYVCWNILNFLKHSKKEQKKTKRLHLWILKKAKKKKYMILLL